MRSACVIGHPVSHSLSPRLHGYWLRHYGIDGSYTAHDVPPENLAGFIKKFPQQFIGGNVTIPHKEMVMRLLDEVDDIARAIGAVNTLIVTRDGKLRGINTDAYGFMQNIKTHVPQGLRKNRAVVLGAGGAARAVVKALLDEGFAEICITNRTREKAETLASVFGNKISAADWQERSALLAGADLLVNTTSLGLAGGAPLGIELAALPGHAVVADIVYRPLITPLLASAQAAGYATVDGLGMLIHQAAAGFEAWFGRKPEVTQELRDYLLA